MSERVKVAVRLRPLIEEELISKDKSICVETVDPIKKVIVSKELNPYCKLRKTLRRDNFNLIPCLIVRPHNSKSTMI